MSNRKAFSIVFHNGFPDEKPIVTMSVRINHPTRYKKLSQYDKDDLIAQIKAFRNSLDVFEKEVQESIDKQ